MRPEDIDGDLDHVLLSEEQIHDRIGELAAQIESDYAGRTSCSWACSRARS